MVKVIPVSVIDKKIAEFENAIKNLSPSQRHTETHRMYDILIITLEDLRKNLCNVPATYLPTTTLI